MKSSIEIVNHHQSVSVLGGYDRYLRMLLQKEKHNSEKCSSGK